MMKKEAMRQLRDGANRSLREVRSAAFTMSPSSKNRAGGGKESPNHDSSPQSGSSVGGSVILTSSQSLDDLNDKHLHQPNPDIAALSAEVRKTRQLIKNVRKKSHKSAIDWDEYLESEAQVGMMLADMGVGEAEGLASLCSRAGAVFAALTTSEAAKTQNQVMEDNLTNWYRTHIDTATELENRYDKTRRQANNVLKKEKEKVEEQEKNYEDMLVDIEAVTLQKFQETKARKQFELVDMVSNLVNLRIQNLTKALNVLQAVKPVLEEMKATSQVCRREFPEKFPLHTSIPMSPSVPRTVRDRLRNPRIAGNKASPLPPIPTHTKTKVFGVPLKIVLDRTTPRPPIPPCVNQMINFINLNGMVKREGLWFFGLSSVIQRFNRGRYLPTIRQT
eukprot:TRINITY_DN5919_c0_g1_i1.p1 TRINITY_DN5919_c0_g1~~TRINITY_DN5919_c0_g1_i1.p1  ORF type:complete len:391 (+),score=61.67 TRINITY_DN5919_c0_g1_i1:151-1323(+)